VTRLCRLFAVTRAGFYAWRRRPVSARRRQDRDLLEDVRAIFEGSGGTYGSPRIQRALQARCHRVSGRRVAPLMREDGLRARVARVYRGKAGVHRWFSRHRITCAGRTRRNRIRSGSARLVGDRALVPVQYHELGRLEVGKFSAAQGEHEINVVVRKTPWGWRIDDPATSQRISVDAALSRIHLSPATQQQLEEARRAAG
jgi:hypothetical protein